MEEQTETQDPIANPQPSAANPSTNQVLIEFHHIIKDFVGFRGKGEQDGPRLNMFKKRMEQEGKDSKCPKVYDMIVCLAKDEEEEHRRQSNAAGQDDDDSEGGYHTDDVTFCTDQSSQDSLGDDNSLGDLSLGTNADESLSQTEVPDTVDAVYLHKRENERRVMVPVFERIPRDYVLTAANPSLLNSRHYQFIPGNQRLLQVTLEQFEQDDTTEFWGGPMDRTDQKHKNDPLIMVSIH